MTGGFTTIGHSNRPQSEIIGMLRDARVTLLVDVRSFPRSRSNPDFNVDVFPDALEQVQIGYRHMPDLGGRRPKQPDIDPAINDVWRVQSFHNYADYALSDQFGTALGELTELGEQQVLSMMCAEAVWWRCHRRIITDHLLLNGHEVTHLMAPGRADPARPTPGAQVRSDGRVIYPGPDPASSAADPG